VGQAWHAARIGLVCMASTVGVSGAGNTESYSSRAYPQTLQHLDTLPSTSTRDMAGGHPLGRSAAPGSLATASLLRTHPPSSSPTCPARSAAPPPHQTALTALPATPPHPPAAPLARRLQDPAARRGARQQRHLRCHHGQARGAAAAAAQGHPQPRHGLGPVGALPHRPPGARAAGRARLAPRAARASSQRRPLRRGAARWAALQHCARLPLPPLVLHLPAAARRPALRLQGRALLAACCMLAAARPLSRAPPSPPPPPPARRLRPRARDPQQRPGGTAAGAARHEHAGGAGRLGVLRRQLRGGAAAAAGLAHLL
jgi:hypothetical protein